MATTAAAIATVAPAQTPARVPVGLLIWAVRDEEQRDLFGTLRAVAKMGYEGVQFWAPYFYWTPEYTRQVRKQLDDLGLPCLATYSESSSFTPDGLIRAMELNQILGSQSIVAARGLAATTGSNPYHGFEGTGLDGYKRLAERLQQAAERLRAVKMTCAFHNHAIEFRKIDGIRPIDIIAGAKDVMFQNDVAFVAEGGADPVAFIEQYPGRTDCILCTDWPRNARNRYPLLGQGGQPWKKIFAAAESRGGVRSYVITQENSDDSPMDAVRKDLEYFRQLHG
ncbi:MAG: sugar phosphate isomerase/epimerase [Candidatus Sulfopaludibacter sp.]|nr:sugar phosphate isomerase/epimerase [Candidatus Sulfopaludibacter sp.]